MQKSVEVKVVNRSNQVETQGKSLSTIAIPLTQDTKHFQLAKNMLNHNPLSSQRPVALLLLLRQGMIFGFLERGLAILMKFCQTLVPSVRQDPNVLRNVQSIVLEKLKVMLATLAKGGRHNFSGFLVSDQLRFLSMALLFATVVRFLVFFGRSTGCSLASTRITSKTVLLG